MTTNFNKSKNSILNDIIKKNAEDGNTKIIRNILLADIEENPLNEKTFNMNDIEKLAETIKAEGFSGSIDVIDLENGKYQIFSGHRRYRAMKLLGKESIPCTIENKINGTLLKRKLLSSNIQSRKMLPLDYSRAIDVYKGILKEEHFKGDMRENISNFFNISGGQVYRYEALGRMIPRLQNMANEPEFPFTVFLDANKLNEQEQEDLADRIDFYKKEHPNFGISKIVVQQFIAAIERDHNEKEQIKKIDKINKDIVNKTVDQDTYVSKRNDSDNSNLLDDIDEKEQMDGKRGIIANSFKPSFENIIQNDDDTDIEEEIVLIDKKNKENHLKSTEKTNIAQIKKEREDLLINNIDFDLIRVARTLKYLTNKAFTVSVNADIKNAIIDLNNSIKAIDEKIK